MRTLTSPGPKVVAGLLALAFVLPAGQRNPGRLLLAVGWTTAAMLLLYGGLGWLHAVLWETDVFDILAALGPRAARWKLIFWDRFWVLGGVLFLLAVRRFQARPPAQDLNARSSQHPANKHRRARASPPVGS